MKYRVTARATFEVVALIEASNEKEALEKAYDLKDEKGVNVCVHGSELMKRASSDKFILVDGLFEEVLDFDVQEEEEE